MLWCMLITQVQGLTIVSNLHADETLQETLHLVHLGLHGVKMSTAVGGQLQKLQCQKIHRSEVTVVYN